MFAFTFPGAVAAVDDAGAGGAGPVGGGFPPEGFVRDAVVVVATCCFALIVNY